MGRDQTKSKEVAAMAFSSAFRKKTEEASSLAVASDSTGYKGLYGGLDKRGIQDKKRLKPKDNPLDHMGSTELAANLFVRPKRRTSCAGSRRKVRIARMICTSRSESEFRQTIRELGGTMPENLPTAENIEKVAKRLKRTALSGLTSGDASEIEG